jgi:predicted phosphodiesterase
LKIIVIADEDQLVGQLPEQKADLLISLGDLFDNTIEKAMGRYGCPKAFAVKGNHDSSGKFNRMWRTFICRLWNIKGSNLEGLKEAGNTSPKEITYTSKITWRKFLGPFHVWIFS